MSDTNEVIAMRSSPRKRQVNPSSSSVFTRRANSEVTYEIISGLRIYSFLLYVKEEQQLYRMVKTQKKTSTFFYECHKEGCRCRVYIRDKKCFIAGNASHIHPSQAETYANLNALNEIKKTLRRPNNRLKPKNVYYRVMKKYVHMTHLEMKKGIPHKLLLFSSVSYFNFHFLNKI